MAWKETDERLIRRGELILDPSLLESHEQELKTMNKGRRGRPYLLANTYVKPLSAVRYSTRCPTDSSKASQEHYTDWSQPRHQEPTTRASGNGSSA